MINNLIFGPFSNILPQSQILAIVIPKNQNRFLILLFHNITQRIIISMHYNPRAKQIGAKFLESKDYFKELLFIRGVVLLGFIKGFTRIVMG